MNSLKLCFAHEGQVARVALAAPKANIVDQAMKGLRPSGVAETRAQAGAV